MSLLPNAFRIQDDFPFVLKRSIPVAAPVTKPVPVNDWAMATSSDKPPRMVRLRLTDEAESLVSEWESMSRKYGCRCCIFSSCSLCTHEGHPISIEENDCYWVMGFEGDQP